VRLPFPTLLALCLVVARWSFAAEPFELPADDGYRGIWYAVGKTKDQYGYKYSGGMATYPQQHSPIAVYAPAANKTFFVYGGAPASGKQTLLHMVSYFDHAAGTVPRPRILLDKQTTDAHDNPTLQIDPAGHLWIFSNSHGTSRPSYIHRSAKPYSIDAFERVATTNFSYGQPWVLADGSFLFMHTRYQKGRRMFWMTSRDGRKWSEPSELAYIAQGHYQQSWTDGRRVATAFNYHPAQGGLDARTNLYYLETADAGRTWKTVAGEVVSPPLTEIRNPALVRDYESEGLLVYLKQLRFDAAGRPVILYETSRGHEPGPANDPRTWRIARWDGVAWQYHDVTTSDHNYDFGAMYLEPDGWRLIAPTEPGAIPYTTGGQMVLWTSPDEGRTWHKEKSLTHDEHKNHTFARQPLGAQPDFYAFWADGDTLRPSASSLYFTDRAGTHVWRLPEKMDGPTAKSQIAW
jgi:hypothetical protein